MHPANILHPPLIPTILSRLFIFDDRVRNSLRLGKNLSPPSQNHPASRHLCFKLNGSSRFESRDFDNWRKLFLSFRILSRRFFLLFPFFRYSFGITVGKKFHRAAIGRCFLQGYKIFLSRRIETSMKIYLLIFFFFNLSSFNRNFRKNRSGMESQIGFDYR